MPQARKVTVIPPTLNLHTHLSKADPELKKVAGYARVSTESDEQFTSYAAQIDYYTEYISRRPDWRFVKVYTDEGISGTNTKKRDGFNEMIKDALAGKIDLIVTKSVSRFARNTVDSLVTIRKLKEAGVEVYFEKENIYTFDSKGELLLTIMFSLAQEESRSISENVTWGQRKRFADGKVNMPYKNFLGYCKGADGTPKVVPEEAELIRKIYRMYMSGKTCWKIASELTEAGIPSPTGKSVWRSTTVNSILKNEKYKGSALLQKEFTVDFLTKKRQINCGEVPQYYVENSHEAIIDPIEWQEVQNEMDRRSGLGGQYSCTSIFSCKIVCGDCGSYYGLKVWHSTSAKYRKTVLLCNRKYKDDRACRTPTLDEKTVKERFLAAYNQLLRNKESLLDDCRAVFDRLTDYAKLDEQIEATSTDITLVIGLIKQCVSENAKSVGDQKAYIEHYNALAGRCDKLKETLESLQTEKKRRQAQADRIAAFMFELSERENTLTEFDNRLWLTVVDAAVSNSDGTLTFRFYNGTEINV